jgi:hypothetical protein
MRKRIGTFPVFLLAAVISGACSENTSSLPVSFVDESITEFTNLGFLGAAGHGAKTAIKVPDPARPDHFVDTGGVVLREIDAGAPLSEAGLEVGDVVIRVMEDYLPIKEDPSLDFLARLESAFSAGKNVIALEVLRRGAVHETLLSFDPEKLPPLGQGDFKRNERYAKAARNGLEYLKSVQEEDGSFPVKHAGADAKLAVTSVAGLAFMAAGGLEEGNAYGENLSKCLAYMEKALDPEKSPDTKKIGHLGGAFALQFLSEYMHQKMEMSVMTLLAMGMQKVATAQQEDGGWLLGSDGNEPGYNERTLATHLCLQALGAAERAGVLMNNEPFEKACGYLKAHTNDGNVGFVPEPDFDRRSEAGRVAGILAAMRSISCSFGEAYMQKLFKYYSGYTKEIAQAPVDESIHLLSAAILSRQKGLPQWMLFNEENQVLLLSLQKTDGSFVFLPKARRKTVPFFDDLSGPAWRTAVYSLIFLLQEDALPLLVAKADPAWTKTRDSDGKVKEEGAPAFPETGQPVEGQKNMMIISGEDAIEAMKKMGFDENSKEMKQIKEQLGKKKKK